MSYTVRETVSLYERLRAYISAKYNTNDTSSGRCNPPSRNTAFSDAWTQGSLLHMQTKTHTYTHTVLRQLTYLNLSYCSEKNTFLIGLRTILNFQLFGIFFQAEGMQKICKIQISIRGIVKKKKASFIHTVDLLF